MFADHHAGHDWDNVGAEVEVWEGIEEGAQAAGSGLRQAELGRVWEHQARLGPLFFFLFVLLQLCLGLMDLCNKESIMAVDL